MKYICVAFALLVSTGCEVESPTAQDQCLRVKLFHECLEKAPAGPNETHYNDWSELVDECDNSAYWQSRRPKDSIPDECRV